MPSPEVWKKRNISGFIKKYPGSDKLNVMDFALSNGVMNFKCGLGETCDAGQICGPIPGPVWHILQAVQVWNNIQEQLNKAVNFASTSVSKTFKISDILTMVVSVVSLIISAALLIFPFTTAMGVAIGMSSAVALSQAGTALAAQNAFNGLKSDAFSRWSTFSGAIAAWQTDMQASAKKESDRVLKTAIGDDKGFHGVIGNGTYFVNKLEINTFDMEKNLRNVVKYRLLNSIFNGMNAFVTIDRDKCDHGGPGGGFKLEEGWLSHCKDGWMRNIIYPKGKKAGNKIYNAALIPTKYETSVEYIVDQSENCQRKYGWRHDPYKDSTLPKSPDGECIFNLPICYVGEHKGQFKLLQVL
ncbi:expressed protein [Phakopsora pachyrhizi]|uniref:Expressed protein n=1 Tax=Phakopsora pachyrhizi TaxID=170000 RepID=A0AAV0BCF1_PHAPC|nr:expressed protein [Phakopsora pachyrhizi]